MRARDDDARWARVIELLLAASEDELEDVAEVYEDDDATGRPA
jgi:hypothetical protein